MHLRPIRTEILTPEAFAPFGWMLGKPCIPLDEATFESPVSDFWSEHLFDTAGGDYEVGFIASSALNVPNPAELHQLATFPLITFARKTQPYELVKSLFNRPDPPAIKLHASASMATVVHLALEGVGIAVIPISL